MSIGSVHGAEAAVGTGARPAPVRVARRRDRFPAWLRELVLVALLFVGYKAGRLLTGEDVREAFRNAREVWSVERILHLPSELVIQQWFLQWPSVVEFANTYYAWVHFPATVGFLIWLYRRDRPTYVWTRNVMAALTVAAMLIHALLPLAPPRMMSNLGFVDTGVEYGQSVYASQSARNLVNQFAAMPSLHVGWALIVAIGVILVLRSRWRWLALLHPALTLSVVVVTANHYWVDALVAAVLLIVTMVVLRPSAAVLTGAPAPTFGSVPAPRRAGAAS